MLKRLITLYKKFFQKKTIIEVSEERIEHHRHDSNETTITKTEWDNQDVLVNRRLRSTVDNTPVEKKAARQLSIERKVTWNELVSRNKQINDYLNTRVNFKITNS